MSETIPDDLTREAADIVLGFAKDLTNAGAMIELVARALLSERQSSRVEELEAALTEARAETFDEAAGLAIPAIPSDKTAFDGIERYRATLNLYAAHARATLEAAP